MYPVSKVYGRELSYLQMSTRFGNYVQIYDVDENGQPLPNDTYLVLNFGAYSGEPPRTEIITSSDIVGEFTSRGFFVDTSESKLSPRTPRPRLREDASFVRTRKSISTQIRDRCQELGLSCEYENSPDGRGGWRIEGEWLTPGEAADKYLVGGFAGNYNRWEEGATVDKLSESGAYNEVRPQLFSGVLDEDGIYQITFSAYNGMSYTIDDELEFRQMCDRVEGYLLRADSKGLELQGTEVGQNWASIELQYPESGVGDDEGTLHVGIDKRFSKCEGCGQYSRDVQKSFESGFLYCQSCLEDEANSSYTSDFDESMNNMGKLIRESVKAASRRVRTVDEAVSDSQAQLVEGAAEAKIIRKALKDKFGLTSFHVSVTSDSFSMGSSVDVVIKDPAVKYKDVMSVASEQERVRRDEYSGEILGGGNMYLHVRYDYDLVSNIGYLWQSAIEVKFKDVPDGTYSSFKLNGMQIQKEESGKIQVYDMEFDGDYSNPGSGWISAANNNPWNMTPKDWGRTIAEYLLMQGQNHRAFPGFLESKKTPDYSLVEAAYTKLLSGDGAGRRKVREVAVSDLRVGSRVTNQPRYSYDGSPVDNWPDPQFCGTVVKVYNNAGLDYAKINFDSGQVRNQLVDNLTFLEAK